MKILVTGGAGYVGSACLRALLAAGHEAVAFDNLIQGHREAVPDGRLIVGDIRDTDALVSAMQSINADGVMHFAAATCVGESVDDPDYHYNNNIGGTLSLLNAMRKAGVEANVVQQYLCDLWDESQSAHERRISAGSVQPLCTHEADCGVDDPGLRACVWTGIYAAALLQCLGCRC